MELRNPVVPLLNMRQDIRQSPERILERALQRDEEEYLAAKERYEESNTGYGLGGHSNHELRAKMQESGDKEFMPKSEFLQFREQRSKNLLDAYEKLLAVPAECAIEATPEVKALVGTLAGNKTVARRGLTINQWEFMEPYWKWVVAVYGKAIVDRYGSLELVHSTQVPLGVVSVMKTSKVRWQG